MGTRKLREGQPARRPHSLYSDIAGSLRVFVEALRTGATPMGEVHENVMSLVMVEASVQSARTGQRVLVDEVLQQAHSAAVQAETRPEVREVLLDWPSVLGDLG
ncbi:hypothetical protein AB0E81_37755 [Streptomyces sp. NPDC033538]|uniref:hypothetical protein n=1 Tax=Streptomyces sp. NPDC033538 TaxID=3155367 RepID=UPI0033E1606C